MPSSERLQKFIASCGVCSRRKAEELIRQGKVRVNGQIVQELGTKIDPSSDHVKIGNKVLKRAKRGLLLFHKPKNVVSTLSDPEGRPTVADALPSRWKDYFPVGRLDFETTGLLLFTNDGDLANRLLHPRYGLKRRYKVRVKGSMTVDQCRKISSEGLNLDDGPIKLDVRLEDAGEQSSNLRVTISEGRNRVIRRSFEKLGHPVLKLHRVAHGPLELGSMKAGEIFALPGADLASLRGMLNL